MSNGEAASVPQAWPSEDDLRQLDGCDFIDFGCKSGGSFEMCETVLGGARGLGIDINPKHVEAIRQKGGHAILGDITSLQLPKNCVRFVSISHVLEHLPNWDAVRAAVQNACDVARDFVVIVGPYFDADIMLRDQGFKLFWSDWTWHPMHVTALRLCHMLQMVGQPCFTCWGRYPIHSSAHTAVLPLDAPPNQNRYDPKRHSPKAEVQFDFPLFKEIVVVIVKRPLADLEEVLRRMQVSRILGPYSQLDIAYLHRPRLGC